MVMWEKFLMGIIAGALPGIVLYGDGARRWGWSWLWREMCQSRKE